MTSNDFRRYALGLPGVVEAEHMGHPDFRVGGKIFASLGYPNAEWGMVKLAPNDQQAFVRNSPDSFVVVKGAWGRAGATNVQLASVASASLRKALSAAWNFTVPKTFPRRKAAPTRSQPRRPRRARA